MRQHGIVHPDMLERLEPNFYPSLCTIRVATFTDSSTGESIPAWADLADHVDLSCRIAAVNSREQRNSEQVYALATHHVSFNGYYPLIEAMHEAIVDGITYQIEGPPQHDGNDETTRFFVRILDP